MLKPGGRLVIADFVRKQERTGQAAHFHTGGSSVVELTNLLTENGFENRKTESLRPKRFSAFTGAGIVLAYKTTNNR